MHAGCKRSTGAITKDGIGPSSASGRKRTASHQYYGCNMLAGHPFGATSKSGVKLILTIQPGRNTSQHEEPPAVVAKVTSLIQLCPKVPQISNRYRVFHETFERLELCELETLTHSS